MNAYENAPATAMLASCAVCGRPLLDAVSVEAGVGPDCRQKHGYGEAQGSASWTAVADALRPFWGDGGETEERLGEMYDHEPRTVANVLVRSIASQQTGPAVKAYVVALEALGFVKLARRIAERCGAVTVTAEGDELVVEAPFSQRFNEEAWRSLRGSRFDRVRKARIVPARLRRELWNALVVSYGPGTLVIGSRGMVRIGDAA